MASMNEIQDPSTIGVGGLKGINNKKEAETPTIAKISNKSDYLKYVNLANQINPTSREMGFVGINDSRQDKKIKSYSQLIDLNETRAESQSSVGQLANGLAKGAILAGTTFLDGTVGLVAGLGQGLTNLYDNNPDSNFWSGVWDNDFSKGMKAINEWSEEVLPNYYSNEELEEPWYKNVFSANFIGDKFIKNIGFTIGAFYSGGAVSSGLGGIARGATKLAKHRGATIKTVKNMLGASSIVNAGVGAGISALNEGRIEALNNSEEWFNLQKAKLDDTYKARLEALEGYENESWYNDLKAREEAKYTFTLNKLSEDRAKMGNHDMFFNLPILMASNILQFGSLYANGFKTAKKANNLIGRPGNLRTTMTKGQGITKAALNPLSEGFEEVAQKASSVISGDYYEADVQNFYKSKIDPLAEQDTLNWINAFAKGIAETALDPSTQEEFFIGFLTGALGMPVFGKANTQDAYLGRGKSIGLTGGIIGEYKNYTEQMAEEQSLADYINSRVQSPEYLNYYQGLIRHNKYQSDMDTALEAGDERAFKDAEFAQLISDITMFDKAGMIEDLKASIEEAAGTNDQDLESIITNTTSIQDGALIGPFAQYASLGADGTIEANLINEDSKKAIRDKINSNKDNILNTVDTYVNIKDTLLEKYGDRFSKNQLEDLVWMQAQIQNWQERAASMADSIKPALQKVISSLDSLLQMASALDEQTSSELSNKLQNVQNMFKFITSLDSNQFINILSRPSNATLINSIVGEVKSLDASHISVEDKDSVVSKLEDISKIGKARSMYESKLAKYLDNPQELQRDTDKAHESKAQESKDIKTKGLRDSLLTATSVQEFKNALSKHPDYIEAEEVVNNLVKENNALATSYTAMKSYSIEVINAINKLNIDNELKNLVLKAFRKHESNSENLNQLANPSRVLDYSIYTDIANESNLQEVQDALQEVIYTANESTNFKNRFYGKYKRPKQQGTPVPNAPENTTTGSSETSTIPPVGDPVAPSVIETPIGDDSFESISKENMLNSSGETLEDKSGDKKMYYRPAIPEIHQEASRKGDFRPFDEVMKERGLNFAVIYKYLKDKGAFDYINEGKLSAEDEVGFMIDLEFEASVTGESWHTKPTIFLIDKKNGQVIGSLDEGRSVINFEGLADLEERIRSEYINRPKTSEEAKNTEKFIATPTTKVSKIMVGKIPYTKEEISLAKIPGVMGEDRNPILGVMISGSIYTNIDSVSDSDIIKPQNISNKEGRLYLLIPNGAGKYSPVAVRVKHFNATEFNPKDVEVQNTTVFKNIQEAVNQFSLVTNEDELKEAVGKIKTFLYLGNVHIDWISTKEGHTGIRFTKVERDNLGREVYKIVNGNRVRKEISKTVFFTNKTSDKISTEITDVLMSFNLPIQVNARMLNSNPGYTEMLINSNVLTSNLQQAKVVSNWFTLNPIDKEGNMLNATNPERKAADTYGSSPVEGNNSVISGTKVISVFSGSTYYVDNENSVIRDNQGKSVPITDGNRILFDIAWAQETFGDSKDSSVMIDNKVITPEGKVLDRSKQKYLEGNEAKRIKDLIQKKDSPEVEELVLDKKLDSHNPVQLLDKRYDFGKLTEGIGFFEMDGKLHKGYINSIANIEGTQVYLTKIPVMSKGLGRSTEYVAAIDYYVVFPNGNTHKVMENASPSTDYNVIVTQIVEALEKNPNKVKDLASQQTVLTSLIQNSGTVTGGAAQANALLAGLEEEELDDEDEAQVLAVFREASGNKPIFNKEQELSWLNGVLPQLSKEDRVKFVKGLIDVANDGTKAWGMLNNGIVTLSDIAAEGTIYHEAFHVVFNLLLDQNERTSLLNEYREKYPDMDNLSLEEELAEDFREFIMQGGKDTRSLGRKIIDFFKSLFIKTKYWKNFRPSSMYYYRAINNSYYSNKPLSSNNSINRTRVEEYTNEMQQIKDQAIANGTFMKAPNGKPTNLTERQWLQVRTKAFINWFGDWINDPENASKVVDKNGEPLVVYHRSNTSGFTIFNLNNSTKPREQLFSYAYHTGTKKAAEEVETYGSKDLSIFELFVNIKHPAKLTEFTQGQAIRTLTDFTGYFAKRNYGKQLPIELFNKYRDKVSMDNSPEEVRVAMKEVFDYMGFDGYYYTNEVEDPGSTSWAVLNPNQLKSATDNVGTFSKENNDIRYRKVPNLSFETIDSNIKELLINKGWTEERFNSISQDERDHVIKCLGV
jgi:hypothetical protein